MDRMKKGLAVLTALCLTLCLFVTAGAAEQKQYLVLGDSIGYGAGIQNPGEANYGKIIANTNGFAYRNRAVNGNKTDDMKRWLQDDDYCAEVAAADIISISIGGNDFLRSNFAALVAQGTFDNYDAVDEILVQFRENLDQIMTRIRALNPDALILFQTLYNPAPTANLKKVYTVAIGGLNEEIAAYRDAHPGVYEIVDVAAAMDAKTGQIAGDNIHPNAAGNLTIAQAVQDKLVSLGVASSAQLTVEVQPENWGTPSRSLFDRIRDFFRGILNFFRRIFRFG